MTSPTARRKQSEPNSERSGHAPAARRRRPLRLHLRNGIEAALRADPERLDESRTRTYMGRVVRSLVQEAGKGKTPSLKLMLALIDWEDPDEQTDADEAAAIETRDDEPKWDWNEAGDWDYSPRANAGNNAEAAIDRSGQTLPRSGEAGRYKEEENYFKNELRRRFLRLAEADAVEAARKARLNGGTALSSTADAWSGAPADRGSPGSSPSTNSG